MSALTRLAITLAGAFGMAATLLVGPTAGSASAYHVSSGGSPGTVSVPAVVGTHYRQSQNLCYWQNGVCYPYQTYYWNPVLQFQADTVSRSPLTTGAQSIERAIFVYRYDGGWQMQAGADQTFTIPAGTSRVSLPQRWVYPTKAGYLKAEMYLTWRNPSTGKVLGVRKIVFDQAYDYNCATQYPCQAHQGGYIWLVRP